MQPSTLAENRKTENKTALGLHLQHSRRRSSFCVLGFCNLSRAGFSSGFNLQLLYVNCGWDVSDVARLCICAQSGTVRLTNCNTKIRVYNSVSDSASASSASTLDNFCCRKNRNANCFRLAQAGGQQGADGRWRRQWQITCSMLPRFVSPLII